MKTAGTRSVFHEGIYHDRIVRHVVTTDVGMTGTVRLRGHVWEVRANHGAYRWETTGLSDKSYFGGGRNARLLEMEV